MSIEERAEQAGLRSDNFDSGTAEERDVLEKELKTANTRIAELTALCYQVVNHFENEFFNNQSMLRAIRDRLNMTADVWAIVNKSKEQQQEPSNS